MDYGFDSGIDRRGTNSEKWDAVAEGVLPLWVADMDFPCAPAIMEAIRRRAEHAALGYTHMGEDDYAAVMGYYARHHGWRMEKEQLLFTPGVVDSMLLAVHALTQPGDKVLIQTPVYGPFYGVNRKAGREIVENPLVLRDGRWEMDFDDLDQKLSQCKLMLLCSPHNPVGRVWERAELERVASLCKAHNVLLMADEIHCDFVYPGHVHTPLLTLPGAQTGMLSAVSATKTFNIAGLKHSTLVVPDAQLRRRLQDKAGEIGMSGGNLFAVIATTAAYTLADGWLEQLKQVLLRNRDTAVTRLNGMGLKVISPEGTYLCFVDMRALHMDCQALDEALQKEAKVRLNRGTDFGAAGEGYMRLNLATPAARLAEGLDRIQAFVEARR